MTLSPSVAPTGGADRLVTRQLLGTCGFGRLLALRCATQCSDGVFQVGLGGAVLFNPERQAAPMSVAAGLAVLLLPYSLVGPFAGALLDRWDRRRVLLGANVLRCVPVVLVALAVGAGGSGAPLYLGALLATGLSRFGLAGMSAGLPHVAPARYLVQANALTTTLGAAATALGGICAIGLRGLIGPGNTASAWVTGTAVLGSLAAAAIAAGFPRAALGPECGADTMEGTTHAVARGLRDGLAAAARVPSVAAGLVALLAHRLALGIVTLVTLLLYRNSFTSHGLFRAGLSGVCELLATGTTGVLLAAVLTPVLVARFGRRRTVRGALLAAGVAVLALAVSMLMPTVLAAVFVLATAGQVVKLSLDTMVQTDVMDTQRGRVFAVYDMIFNVSYVLAITLTATAVPPTGRAPSLLLLAAATYFLAIPLNTLIAAPHSAGSAGLRGPFYPAEPAECGKERDLLGGPGAEGPGGAGG